MVITIDGPVASGKSTMARLLAQRLGFYYINSGFLFRAAAYLLVNRYGYDATSLASVSGQELVEKIMTHAIAYRYADGAQISIDGVDVTARLKDAVIDRAASLVSVYPEVRDYAMQLQRTIARDHDCVVEGRDAGSVVFPDAAVHIFLTAPLSVRAQRWQKDQLTKCNNVSYEAALSAVAERDARDSSRAYAPLCVPEHAVVIDSGDWSENEVLTELLRVVQQVKK